ncbi:hypothetical protein G7Y89_g1702 [Cudoniella acicularis]|uniref:Heterokaryon incompatibility domain-containing protein n=1 Tax=Cudoniella acicularis TaxID=354080 RepID=A0A8H4RUT3_9HELO|nr:hypothetical protein G7Y89_g1702 [Cudoniella acicularis]
MHLLNTSTLDLHEFFGDDIPPYAILSHRWKTEEISFQDLQTGLGLEIKEGFSKIKGCCAQAVLDGWEYAWVDSCCIDKTSSAELSEAINSMFQWYKDSQVCYVYMSDVPTGLRWDQHLAASSEFRLSKWWARGWTLQELLAPKDVIFYDCQWEEIGTKKSLEILISSVSGISRSHLMDYEQASVAQKMSWASKRHTTRVEDQAYSLIGLFQVHMPPLYGEGQRAFHRLQLEILANSDDESIFAWEWASSNPDSVPPGLGLLADSPHRFLNSGNIRKAKIDSARPPFAMTNKGLRMELFLMPNPIQTQLHAKAYFAPLNCKRTDEPFEPVAICLHNILDYPHSKSGEGGCEYEFERQSDLVSLSAAQVRAYQAIVATEPRTIIFVKQGMQMKLPTETNITEEDAPMLLLRTDSLIQHGFTAFHKRTADLVLMQDGRAWHLETLQENKQQSHKEILIESGLHRLFLSFTGSSITPLIPQNPSPTRTSTLTTPPPLPPPKPDTFTIRIHWLWWKRIFSLTIDTPPDDDDAPQLFTRVPPHEPNPNLDRISKTMRSGRSVSAALRMRRVKGESVCVLDVSVDPGGRLWWPRLKMVDDGVMCCV